MARIIERPPGSALSLLVVLCALSFGCRAPQDGEPSSSEPETPARQSSKPLPDDMTGIEDWTGSEEYSWLLERCVKTTELLYFVEDDSLSGLLSEDPIEPELDGFVYSTIPSLDPEEFIPGRNKLFGKPVTAVLPAGTQFNFDQVFVLRNRIGAAKWHFVAPVTFDDGTPRRVDFTYSRVG